MLRSCLWQIRRACLEVARANLKEVIELVLQANRGLAGMHSPVMNRQGIVELGVSLPQPMISLRT